MSGLILCYEAHHMRCAAEVAQAELGEHAVPMDPDEPHVWRWDTWTQLRRHNALTLDMLGCIDAPVPLRVTP